MVKESGKGANGDELMRFRERVLRMLPDDLYMLLNSYTKCRSIEDFIAWREDVVGQIIPRAKLLPPQPDGGGPRGICPLCDHGGDSPWHDGYALPRGLRQHLLGEGNVYYCVMTNAAFSRAINDLQDSFSAAAKAKQQRENQRRRTEPLFLVDRLSPPKAWEEDLWGASPRSAEELAFAAQRLDELGFEVQVHENVISYVFDDEPLVVLADPRMAGRIVFRVFNTRASRKRRNPPEFYILDAWKRDIRIKFAARLESARSRFRK